MSVYSSVTGGQCGGPNQSPINLSQSTTEPCDAMCDLVFDDAYISQANVVISDEGLILQNDAGLGSCKFNGEGYTCRALVVNHPSHHTIENIQADGEVIAIFNKPDGSLLLVSSLFRVNPQQTPSSHFFNAFIPYANSNASGYTSVALGEQWGLFMMVPPAGSYFVYNGTTPMPPCQSATWVVFRSMINIDGNDFALLAKNVAPGSRPIQDLGSRVVYYNDAEQLSGGPMPKDGKVYIRFKKVGKKGTNTKPVKQADLSSGKPSSGSKLRKWIAEQNIINRLFSDVSAVIMTIAFAIGLYFGYKNKDTSGGATVIFFTQWLAGKIHDFFFGMFVSVKYKLSNRQPPSS